MGGNAKFWIGMTVFQVVFGLVVFAATRAYYLAAWQGAGTEATAVSQPLTAWPGPLGQASTLPAPSAPAVPAPSQPAGMNPVELSEQADAYFANQQYEQAAELYERLLALAPDNVDIYNNLAITLHYVGRSAEALEKLHRGVALDPEHQRSWLTLGFINAQLGNTDAAREALAKAAETGSDEQIRASALQLLAELP